MASNILIGDFYSLLLLYHLGRCAREPLFTTVFPPEWPERPGSWTLKGEKALCSQPKKKKKSRLKLTVLMM